MKMAQRDMKNQKQSRMIDQNLSSPEERGKRIQFIRRRLLGYSREKFCGDTSRFVIPHTLKCWELGWGSGLTEKGASQIVQRSKELGIYCSAIWLLYGIGKEATQLTRDIELSADTEMQIAEELLLFRKQANSLDLCISDDAMIPMLFPGDYVGGIIVEHIKTAIHKDCIIIDTENNRYARILKAGSSPGLYSLSALNPYPNFAKKEIDDVSIKFAAPIIWIRRKNLSRI